MNTTVKRNPPNIPAPQVVEPNRGNGVKTLLRERAYRELKRLIQSAAVAPGTFLSERQLVARLGMSKTPIRAALQQLEEDGLVTVSPQQGILVRELTAREVTELFDLRCAVEPFVVRKLAQQLRPDQADRLKENLHAQQAAASNRDSVAATELDVQFHLLLAECLDNREITHLLRRALTKLYREIVRISRHAEGRLQASTEEHARIVKAVLQSDADQAAQRMEVHLRFGRQFLLG
jgi:DNA-binding GntR family transcriptional regulator